MLSQVRPKTGETPPKAADPNGAIREPIGNHEGAAHVTGSYWYAVLISNTGTRVSGAFDSDGKLLLGPCDAIYSSDVSLVTFAFYDDQSDDMVIPLSARVPTPLALMKLTSNDSSASLWALWHRKPAAQAKETT